jgi:hypothetical protein
MKPIHSKNGYKKPRLGTFTFVLTLFRLNTFCKCILLSMQKPFEHIQNAMTKIDLKGLKNLMNGC